MRSPSIETASCCVTTSPSAEKVRGARFSTTGAGDALDQHQRGRRQRILDIGEQVAVAFGFLDVEPPDIDDADLGQAGQFARASSHRPTGVQTSNTGRNSSRIEITSCSPAQKKCCTARRGPASHRTCEIALSRQESRQRHAEHGVGRVSPRSRPSRACAASPRASRHGNPISASVGRSSFSRAPPSSPSHRLRLKKSSCSANQIRGAAPVRSTLALTAICSGAVSNSTGACRTSVPRRHSLTVLA